MMPEDGIAQLADHDAILLGAVGFPGVPDHVSLWGLLIPIRREFDQYVNLRPVRLLPGAPCPLRTRSPAISISGSCARTPKANIPQLGGHSFAGTEREMVQQSLFHPSWDRSHPALCFRPRAKTRPQACHLGDQVNGIFHSMPFWDERFAAIGAEYPGDQD